MQTGGSTTYSTDGMCAWLPSGDRQDLVDFRGCVVAAQPISLPPHPRAGWNLTLLAWNAGGADGLLDLVFAASVWAADAEPLVGSDVEGFDWLVGECRDPALPSRPRAGA